MRNSSRVSTSPEVVGRVYVQKHHLHKTRSSDGVSVQSLLRLMETFRVDQVERGVLEALRLRAISYDAVKQLTLCAGERRPARLNLDIYPYLPKADVATTKAGSYLALVCAGAAA